MGTLAAGKEPQMTNLDSFTNAVVRVGDGRGFIVSYSVRLPSPPSKPSFSLEQRLVLTAAHCLPSLPPMRPADNFERTYKELLGTLGGKTNVWAECLFVDPVSDVAVLGTPDDQELAKEANAYLALVDDAPIFRIGEATNGPGWVLSLDGKWVPSRLEIIGWGASPLEIDPTEPGQSGSPILNGAGEAVGLISFGHETIESGGKALTKERAGDQPILTRALPAWLLGGLL